jgi:hypothetical protein
MTSSVIPTTTSGITPDQPSRAGSSVINLPDVQSGTGGHTWQNSAEQAATQIPGSCAITLNINCLDFHHRAMQRGYLSQAS